IATIDRAHAAGLKVVITPLSLPGARWIQNNGDVYDGRLWRDKAYWVQAQAYWRDLAKALKGRPGIAAYNLINEPTPEKDNGLKEHPDAATAQAWYAQHRGTAQDLPLFYAGLIAAIREVDPDTPIMLDAGWYAAADAFAYWPEKLADPALLYAFHMYEPWGATSAPNLKRNPRFTYPGTIWGEDWDAARVATYLGQPLAWADAHGVPRNRMVAAEFGCMRQLPFCPIYLDDVLNVLEPAGVHWAFYSFREDVWDGMDYEMGGGPTPPRFWDDPWSVKRGPTPQFAPIQRRLKPQ
ncbi:MAG: glycoside hydrolase family 5 protein, partial [Sphingomonas sp.]